MKNTPKPPMVREALCEAVSFFRQGGNPQPSLEAEILLATVLSVDRVQILMEPERLLSPRAWAEFQGLYQKRGEGYPLQYLTGKQEFMSLEFIVNPAVLIPRGDTEVLVERVLSLRQENVLVSEKINILDVGTGSGAIGISLAYYWPESVVTGVDISAAALTVARKNAQKHGVKLEFVQGDLLTPFLDKGQKFQIIVSNPPYIATGELADLPLDVQQEPRQALDGGLDGLDYYRRLISQGVSCLAPQGILALEIGWDQGVAVQALLREQGFQEIELGKDYGGRHRIVTAIYANE